MPEITKVFQVDITPERFLDACSDDELKEIDLLIQSERFQNRIKEKQIGFKTKKQNEKTK
jgi:hypothetical protein